MLQKLIILLCCTYYSFASEHSHTIPVENYETELQDLGQHVDIPETPVKVVKITKTIAVKIPVPYPVKVIEKVPYPVHVSKPYPVPVPHIVHVPHPGKPTSLGGHEHGNSQYQVAESPSYDSSSGGHSFGSAAGGHFQGNSNHGQSFGAQDDDHSSEGGSYDSPSSYYGYSGDNDHDSFESKSYDQALKEYLQKQKSGGNFHSH